jgi:hypothetical protein
MTFFVANPPAMALTECVCANLFRHGVSDSIFGGQGAVAIAGALKMNYSEKALYLHGMVIVGVPAH